MGSILDQKTKPFSDITLTAIEAALASGELLLKGFGTHFQISSKEGRHNLVTEYDLLSEKNILSLIQKKCPDSSFLAEESGYTHQDQKGLLWIVDPLDGTVNFARKIPAFSVSIAAHQNQEELCGVIYQPITKELFVGEKNRGSYLLDENLQIKEKLKVSSVKTLDGSILATGFPYNLLQNPFHCIDHFVDIVKLGIPIRRMGSAAIDLAYTASGRFEGFFEVELGPWDVAAGKIILEEAGGTLSHWDQKPFDIFSKKTVFASNGWIHEEGCKILGRQV